MGEDTVEESDSSMETDETTEEAIEEENDPDSAIDRQDTGTNLINTRILPALPTPGNGPLPLPQMPDLPLELASQDAEEESEEDSGVEGEVEEEDDSEDMPAPVEPAKVFAIERDFEPFRFRKPIVISNI